MSEGDTATTDETVWMASGSTFAVSDPRGDIQPGQPHGLFHRDIRILSRFELRVNGRPAEPLAARTVSPGSGRFVLQVPWAEDGESPIVAVRDRSLHRGLHEEVRITNHGVRPARLAVELRVDADFSDVLSIKAPVRRRLRSGARRATSEGSSLLLRPRRRRDLGTRITVNGGAPRMSSRGPRFEITLAPGEAWHAAVDATPTEDADSRPWTATWTRPVATRMADRCRAWKRRFPAVHSAWEGFDRLYENCLDDLSALLMEDTEGGDDLVVAAGLPWFMTLFGRDSILTSLMTLPYERELASGVLHALARRQGCQQDETSEEEPGKILHEVRHPECGRAGREIYYGTIDATPLFVVLLGQARRWGLPPEEVRAFLPVVRRALRWITAYGDLDGDGYLEYEARRPEPALRNQGWKDSWDGIQFADGRLPEGPIALCEVQGYKYMALVEAAALFEATGETAASAWARREASRLADRFRRDFWMEPSGYPALALDGAKRQVDAVASNAAHLLWTGILAPEQEVAVAQRLVSPELFSGWGVRTLATSNTGYNPVSYHAGSVWPHDTAVAAGGLARKGFVDEALSLIRGLVDASTTMSNRLPELFCGFARKELGFPVAYPASCSPQAWAGASPLLLLRVLLGLRANVPAGRLEIRPILPEDALPLRVEGMRVGSGRLTLTVHPGGGVELFEVPDGIQIDVPERPLDARRIA